MHKKQIKIVINCALHRNRKCDNIQLYRTTFINTEHKIRSRKESNAVSGCEKVFHTMKEKGMDLAVLIDPADIKYVSGFEVPFCRPWREMFPMAFPW